MTTLFVVCGNVNYTNLSRYSGLSERTYRRHFERGVGVECLNQGLIAQVRRDQSAQIAVVDLYFHREKRSSYVRLGRVLQRQNPASGEEAGTLCHRDC